MNKPLITLLVSLSISLAAFAPPDLPTAKLRAPTEVEPAAPAVEAPAVKEPFAAGEWVFSLAGTYAVAQSRGFSQVLKTDPKHGNFGAILGGTKFVTRNIGIGVEAGVSDVNEVKGVEDIDYANVVVIARTPLADIMPSFELTRNIAPYAILGVGHDFHSGKQTAFIGGGVEYRISARVGVYFESRFTFSERDHGDASGTSIGVRVAL